MSAETVWRHWRRQVHDILEVGGDFHPAGRIVNAFIVTLIVLNAVGFAAETVDALKLVRYSPALQTLARVIADEYRALLGALLIILVLLLFASTAAYFLERGAQPDKFGSIPDAA